MVLEKLIIFRTIPSVIAGLCQCFDVALLFVTMMGIITLKGWVISIRKYLLLYRSDAYVFRINSTHPTPLRNNPRVTYQTQLQRSSIQTNDTAMKTTDSDGLEVYHGRAQYFTSRFAERSRYSIRIRLYFGVLLLFS